MKFRCRRRANYSSSDMGLRGDVALHSASPSGRSEQKQNPHGQGSSRTMVSLPIRSKVRTACSPRYSSH